MYSGHNVVATVFIECGLMHRAGGAEANLHCPYTQE